MDDGDVGHGRPGSTETPSGPLSAPVSAMQAAIGRARPETGVSHEDARGEAALVAHWLLGVSGAVSGEALDALDAVVGAAPHQDIARPDMAVVAPGSVLSRLLGAGDHLAAWRYYLAVMELAHEVVALDVYPSSGALALLDVLRASLLGAIDAAGARPGRPSGAGASPADTTGDLATAPRPATGPPTPTADDVEDLLSELDELIGLEPVKAEVRRVADRLLVDRLRTEAGLPIPDVSRHLVFTGNPGTGKTTVARLLGRLYAAMGVVADGHLVETDREGLVAGFVGQTATRVKERFDEADGGVLLIDEAYSLARGGEKDFGREAIDAVVKLCEDRRDRVVVILTGYPAEMAELIDANPGMASRFPKTIHFPDYEVDELTRIAVSIAARSSYRFTPAARRTLEERFAAVPRGRGFGNGRLARNLVEATIDRQASRLAELARAGERPEAAALSSLYVADVPPDVPGHRSPDDALAPAHLDPAPGP